MKLIKLIVPKFWQRRNIISYLLLPFSLIYRFVFNCYQFYCKFSTTNFSVPIIVAGNITVGGTGKTPLVIYLVELLKSQGYHPGVVSRGYGREKKGLQHVKPGVSISSEVGDEAILIARRAQCPIVVDNDRVAAVSELLSVYNCDVVISDDGLQHYMLHRLVEIALIDAEFGVGNGFCLPAGPLREPVNRLKKVNFLVKNFNTNLSAKPSPGKHRLTLRPSSFLRQVKNPDITRDIEHFKGHIIHAVAGIGRPERFFATLRELGLDIIEHSFPDHYTFSADDFAFGDKKIVIMTEKDAIKCDTTGHENFWYLEVVAELDSDFDSELLSSLTKYKGIQH